MATKKTRTIASITVPGILRWPPTHGIYSRLAAPHSGPDRRGVKQVAWVRLGSIELQKSGISVSPSTVASVHAAPSAAAPRRNVADTLQADHRSGPFVGPRRSRPDFLPARSSSRMRHGILHVQVTERPPRHRPPAASKRLSGGSRARDLLHDRDGALRCRATTVAGRNAARTRGLSANAITVSAGAPGLRREPGHANRRRRPTLRADSPIGSAPARRSTHTA